MNIFARAPRRGVAMVWLLTVLVVLTMLMSAVTWQHVAGRRWAESRQRQLQAEWLARAGIELAASRLLREEKVNSVTATSLLPGSDGRITVQAEPSPAAVASAVGAATPWNFVSMLTTETTSAYAVTSEARWRTDDPPPVVRSLTRRFRRQAAGERVQVVPIISESGR